jgi:hypothetical protein
MAPRRGHLLAMTNHRQVIRPSFFQFLISSFRSGGRYFMWRTASLKVPRSPMIFFCRRMMA